MAQFDVFRTPGRKRLNVPFVVTLQNRRFEAGPTRFVAPLVLSSVRSITESYLAPRFTVGGHLVFLDVFNLATIMAARLGDPIASLADEDSRAKLVRAIDEFTSQA
jgi:toxin CcdB